MKFGNEECNVEDDVLFGILNLCQRLEKENPSH